MSGQLIYIKKPHNLDIKYGKRINGIHIQVVKSVWDY